MNENLDVFICTHVKPHRLTFPKDTTYKVVGQKKEIEIDTDLQVYYAEPEKMEQWGLMPRGLSELFNMYYVRHFIEKKDYIGFCQYRAFPFLNNRLPDIDKEFESCDLLYSKRMVKSVRGEMKRTLDTVSYNLFKEIFNNEYPEYSKDLDRFLNQHELLNRCIFFMKTEEFNKMMDFVFDVLKFYLRGIDCHTDEELYARTTDMIENKTYPKGLTEAELHPLVLSRMLFRFGEFVMSFYIWKNFKRKKPIITTMRGTKRLDGGEVAPRNRR